MYDQNFEQACKEWKEGFLKWEAGERPDGCENDEFWEYEGSPPDRDFYRPWEDHEATWFQVWETVSEGTPVSPPFETKQELVDYLVENGDFWDQKRRRERGVMAGTIDCAPWSREAAENFVNNTKWAPSGIIVDGVPKKPVEEMASTPPPTPPSTEASEGKRNE